MEEFVVANDSQLIAHIKDELAGFGRQDLSAKEERAKQDLLALFERGIEREQARIGVCGHARPDGDTVGSVLGLVTGLKASGFSKVYPLLSDNKGKPSTYSFLENYEHFLSPAEVKEQGLSFDYLVVVDTPTLSRLGVGVEYLSVSENIVRIDHHKVGDLNSEYCWEDTSYASTSLMVFKVLLDSNNSVNEAVALACLTGILTDTGGFRFQNTDPFAFKAAAAMVELGASPAQLANHLFFNKSEKTLALEGRVLSRLSVHNSGRVALSYLSYADYSEIGATREDAEDLTDLVRALGGPDIAVLISKSSQGIRASLRSKGEVNVAEVAERFKGGGHKAAAGISINDPNMSIEEFTNIILKELPGYAD